MKVLKMTSDKAVKKVDKADMIFIDEAHTYEQGKKDIKKITKSHHIHLWARLQLDFSKTGSR